MTFSSLLHRALCPSPPCQHSTMPLWMFTDTPQALDLRYPINLVPPKGVPGQWMSPLVLPNTPPPSRIPPINCTVITSSSLMINKLHVSHKQTLGDQMSRGPTAANHISDTPLLLAQGGRVIKIDKVFVVCHISNLSSTLPGDHHHLRQPSAGKKDCARGNQHKI